MTIISQSVPMMDEGAQRWMLAYAHKNYWRVASWISYEDLVQECYYNYFKVARRYGDVEPRHRMALFKRTVAGLIHDYAKQRSGAPQIPFSDILPAGDDSAQSRFMESAVGMDDELGSLAVLIAKAPKEVLDVLRLLLTDAGRAAMREPVRKVRVEGCRRALRETTNEKLCRLTGYDPEAVDLPTLVRDYLAPA